MHQAQNQRNHWSWWSCVELLVLVFYILVPAAASLPELSPNRTETCQFETHNITCPYNHMILLMSAEFGRMHDGRCIQHPTNMGCKEDVLAFMDKQCGGQRSCRMEVSVLRKKNFNPCVEMESYLETTHVCVPLQSAPHCGSTLGIQGRQSSGYLAPSPRQGQCAWTLQANPGQRINITLYDFEARSATRSAAHSSGSTICPRYATISEGSSSSSSSSRHRQEHPICGGNARVQSVFVSDGSQIDLTMFGSTSHHFLLHYEAIGCSRIAHPANSIVHYSENSMTITCNATHEKWYLTCRGNQWVGQIHNCTADPSSSIWSVLTVDWKSPYGILVIAGLGIIFGVLLGILMLAVTVLIIRRYRSVCGCAYPASHCGDGMDMCDSTLDGSHKHLSKKNTMTRYHPAPQGGLPGKTDVMVCDYTGKQWLTSRPLPDPGVGDHAELVALCGAPGGDDGGQGDGAAIEVMYPYPPPHHQADQPPQQHQCYQLHGVEVAPQHGGYTSYSGVEGDAIHRSSIGVPHVYESPGVGVGVGRTDV